MSLAPFGLPLFAGDAIMTDRSFTLFHCLTVFRSTRGLIQFIDDHIDRTLNVKLLLPPSGRLVKMTRLLAFGIIMRICCFTRLRDCIFFATGQLTLLWLRPWVYEQRTERSTAELPVCMDHSFPKKKCGNPTVGGSGSVTIGVTDEHHKRETKFDFDSQIGLGEFRCKRSDYCRAYSVHLKLVSVLFPLSK